MTDFEYPEDYTDEKWNEFVQKNGITVGKSTQLITKYRPKTFADFIGNPMTVGRLEANVKSGVTHCYAFFGPAGNGKTTAARLTADAHRLAEGYNLTEINCSVCNGVDDVQDRIITRLLYGGRRGYILDEAHCLTQAAQSRLLKPLEEPGEDKFFMLCTNHPEKLSDAFRGRFFHYEFQPLKPDEILLLLDRVCRGEGYRPSQRLLKRVCESSEGIPREAIRLLCEAYGSYRPGEDGDGRVFILQSDLDLLRFRSITASGFGFTAECIRSVHTENLRGKDVTIIQEKNARGRRATEEFLANLQGITDKYRVVEPPGDEIQSLSDWLAKQPEGSDAATVFHRLVEILDNPSPLTFPSLLICPDQLITTFGDLKRQELPERRFILLPWLDEASLTLIVSPPGVGKTLLTMEIAGACSEGRSGMDGLWKPECAVPVLYVDGEMHWDDLRDRAAILGLNGCRLLSNLICDHRNAPSINIVEKGARDFLTSYIKKHAIKLLVLDNIYSLAVGLDHSFEREWSPINQWLISLRNKGVAVILVHHTGKSGDQLGTSARRFNIDYSFTLERRFSQATERGNCSFTILVDKERRPVLDVKDRIYSLAHGKWMVQRLNENENRKAEKKKKLIAGMLVEGLRNMEIAARYGCEPPYITKKRKELEARGYIRKNEESEWEFTDNGEEWYGREVN